MYNVQNTSQTSFEYEYVICIQLISCVQEDTYSLLTLNKFPILSFYTLSLSLNATFPHVNYNPARLTIALEINYLKLLEISRILILVKPKFSRNNQLKYMFFCKIFCRIFKTELHKKYPYLEFFWSVSFHIWTEYSPYSVQMRKNRNQKNSKYERFSCSAGLKRSLNNPL